MITSGPTAKHMMLFLVDLLCTGLFQMWVIGIKEKKRSPILGAREVYRKSNTNLGDLFISCFLIFYWCMEHMYLDGGWCKEDFYF